MLRRAAVQILTSPAHLMQSLLSLLVRHALMLCSGWFAANGIDGSSSVGIITGLLILGIVTAWSLAEKWLNLKPGQLTDSTMLRTIVGSLASQIVTGLSAYFAVDANQPELLGVAVLNAGLSKAGVHQRLAGVKAAQILIASLALLCLPSCESFTKGDAIAFGKRVAIGAGEASVQVARATLVVKTQEWLAAIKEGDAVKIALTKLAVDSAFQALDAAERALAKERGKLEQRTSAKNPMTVWSGDDSLPLHANYPSGHLPEAASAGQSRECGALFKPPYGATWLRRLRRDDAAAGPQATCRCTPHASLLTHHASRITHHEPLT